MIRDHVAARRWLVRVIAARAAALYRERGRQSNPEPSEGGENGHDNAAFSEERSELLDKIQGKSRPAWPVPMQVSHSRIQPHRFES